MRDGCAMKLWLTGLVALAACSPVAANTFEVDATISPEAVATLMLCGKERPLERRGHILTVAQPSTCEGEGMVRVRFKDGHTTDCRIGYVTGGMGQDFRFRLGESGCVPII